jgi:D-lactate dehydrogenase
MKILFYDIKESERNYFLNHSLKNIEQYFFEFPLNNSTFIDKKFLDADAISVFISSVLDKNTLSRFKNLKTIFLRCTGYSHVDIEYCKNHNIKIFNTPNYGSSSVAEFAFGLILNLSRKIIQSQNELKEGKINHNDLEGFELNSKTIGVIGAGHIGSKIIKIAQGFNMKILIYDINENIDYTFSSLDELYKNSDIIVLSCPLTKQTKELINKNSLNKMKKNALIINVARGEIINTRDLAEALAKKKISGCALDVIECEQTLCCLWNLCINTQMRDDCLKKFLFIEKLKNMENVIITPHIAYNTKEAIEEILKITLENIKASFEINKDTKNLVML